MRSTDFQVCPPPPAFVSRQVLARTEVSGASRCSDDTFLLWTAPFSIVPRRRDGFLSAGHNHVPPISTDADLDRVEHRTVALRGFPLEEHVRRGSEPFHPEVREGWEVRFTTFGGKGCWHGIWHGVKCNDLLDAINKIEMTCREPSESMCRRCWDTEMTPNDA